MNKDNRAKTAQQESPAAGDGRDEWHPYKVWREQIRSDETPAVDETELTGSWKPSAVWERQIKRA